jgi:hypothetical protein
MMPAMFIYRWIVGPPPTIVDLWLLAISPDSDTRLHELLDWRTQRAATIAKGAVAAAISFVVTLLVAQFKSELHVGSLWVALSVAGAACIALFGIYIHRRAVLLESQYATFLYTLSLLGP